MRAFLLIYLLVNLIAFSRSAVISAETKEPTKLTLINPTRYAEDSKDLTVSASDRTFHIGKEYGQPGYNIGIPYGTYLGGNSIYGPGTGYRGISPGYRGYGIGPGGIIGSNVGYGYYGNSGYNPSYGGYGGYNGYGGTRNIGGYEGYGGYGGYGGYLGNTGGYGGYSGYGSGYGNYGTGTYGLSTSDDPYNGYGSRYGYGRYGGLDGYGYGGYSGYGGTNYGSSYNVRAAYDPYNYRRNTYGSSTGYPSGYRGYS